MRLPLQAITLFALIATSLLCGCGKPSIDLAVASQTNVNPDHTGRPSPVIVPPIDCEDSKAVGIELRDVTVALIPDEDVSDWDPLEAVKEFHNPVGETSPSGEEADQAASSLVESARKTPVKQSLFPSLPGAQR